VPRPGGIDVRRTGKRRGVEPGGQASNCMSLPSISMRPPVRPHAGTEARRQGGAEGTRFKVELGGSAYQFGH
jgi:hypothetical protein